MESFHSRADPPRYEAESDLTPPRLATSPEDHSIEYLCSRADPPVHQAEFDLPPPGLTIPHEPFHSRTDPPCHEVESDLTPPGLTPLYDAPLPSSHSSPSAESREIPSQPLGQSNQGPTLIYSMDVLRLDSSQSSLHHLSSSMTFAGRQASTVTGTDAIGDSSSLFQLSTNTAAPRVVCSRERSSPLAGPWVYPFPIHSSSTRVSVRIDEINYSLEDPNQGDEHSRGRHICPICRAQFRRPSGLTTHFNSHTGATRKF